VHITSLPIASVAESIDWGIPAVVLSTVVSTSVFASLLKQPDPWLQITLGFASVAAALLASLQTFLSYSERAEKHRIAGAKYGALALPNAGGNIHNPKAPRRFGRRIS
jgi:hypothetical protein